MSAIKVNQLFEEPKAREYLASPNSREIPSNFNSSSKRSVFEYKRPADDRFNEAPAKIPPYIARIPEFKTGEFSDLSKNLYERNFRQETLVTSPSRFSQAQ